ncbi:hypothetical protein BSK48_03750 [Paenibacillus odorifer]|nr:hypothetical protein BSK48_03750 [Paenibacillus odorifer]
MQIIAIELTGAFFYKSSVQYLIVNVLGNKVVKSVGNISSKLSAPRKNFNFYILRCGACAASTVNEILLSTQIGSIPSRCTPYFIEGIGKLVQHFTYNLCQ